MAIILVAMCFFARAQTNSVQIQLSHFVANNRLILDSGVYSNSLGQEFKITKFKYYISNICLYNKNGERFFTTQSFLIDEDNTKSKNLVLEQVARGTYTAIEFIIGVDSLHNCSGAQSGALDPANAMFWAWNTGYIFLKLEGTSSHSKSPGHFFEYHVGGYKQPSNSIRQVKLQDFVIESNQNPLITLKIDVLEILKTPVAIDFSALSSVTDTKNAGVIANNYMDMFSILNVSNAKKDH